MNRLLSFLFILVKLNPNIAMIGSRAALTSLKSTTVRSFQQRRCLGTYQGKPWHNKKKPIGSVPDSIVAVATPVKTHIKRKVALTLSYVGSNYHGLQIDITNKVPTVEFEVEKVLHQIGCIKDSNFGDLTKIQWSRSSRTDKHVHSARLVISAKLEIPTVWTNEDDATISDIVGKCNELLPKDIRVLSACKMNQGFRAKEACTWREYEYVMPKSLLLSNLLPESNNEGLTSDQIANNLIEKEKSIFALFAKSLKRMEGTHSFHNFHRLNAKKIKKQPFNNADGYNNRNIKPETISTELSSTEIGTDIEVSSTDSSTDIEGAISGQRSASTDPVPVDILDTIMNEVTEVESIPLHSLNTDVSTVVDTESDADSNNNSNSNRNTDVEDDGEGSDEGSEDALDEHNKTFFDTWVSETTSYHIVISSFLLSPFVLTSILLSSIILLYDLFPSFVLYLSSLLFLFSHLLFSIVFCDRLVSSPLFFSPFSSSLNSQIVRIFFLLPQLF